jgi:hypothetical protein
VSVVRIFHALGINVVLVVTCVSFEARFFFFFCTCEKLGVEFCRDVDVFIVVAGGRTESSDADSAFSDSLSMLSSESSASSGGSGAGGAVNQNSPQRKQSSPTQVSIYVTKKKKKIELAPNSKSCVVERYK